ncbi:carbohydrate ABC transporter permease [Streptomyces sp. NPDC001508]|uniref:carbohydrate ABC transporter permease n=1 Tax=Streptomyces sp. NPDC001508 TaxID=3154656 RepID=UPI0033198469
MNTASARRARTLAGQAGLHLCLALGGVVMLLPFYVMLRSAFTPEEYILDGSLGLSHLTLANFTTAWNTAPWGRYYLSSLLSTALIFAGQVVTSVPAGYALARLRFKGRHLAFWTVLACFIIPTQVIAIPTYIGLSRAGLGDTLGGLVVPFIASAFGIYLMRQFILSIPQSLFDAARLDRVGPVAMVWRVVLPNVKPGLLALGVFSVIAHWNDLFWPSVILRTPAHATVPYAISQFVSQDTGNQYGPQMAAATLATVPLLVGFLICQRHFVRGIALARGLE